MTPAAELESLRREVDRLRRELEVAFEVAREIGDERNGLAEKLGREVATTEKLRDMLRRARVNLKPDAIWIKADIERELATGRGDGK